MPLFPPPDDPVYEYELAQVKVPVNPADYPQHMRKAKQTFRQSRIVHPNWDADTHRQFLIIETNLPEAFVNALPIGSWLQVPIREGD